MKKEKVLVIGLGEVGSAIYDIVLESGKYETYGYDVEPSKAIDELSKVPIPIDYLHICIPYINQSVFVDTVMEYIEKVKPRLTIIHSTIAPGTTRELMEESGTPVAYSPIRGKHPWLKEHILFWPKWVTALPIEELDNAVSHLRSIGLKVRAYKGSAETLELAKLFETTYRALIIAWWQEIHRIARYFNADIVTIAKFLAEVNEVLGDRPILYPGVIRGHCLIPNTKILRDTYKSRFLDAILESNEKRKRRLKA